MEEDAGRSAAFHRAKRRLEEATLQLSDSFLDLCIEPLQRDVLQDTSFQPDNMRMPLFTGGSHPSHHRARHCTT